MLRWSLRVLKFTVVYLAAFALVVALVVWKISSQPISSTTLTPYVETALESLLPKTRAKIEHTLIVWDNVDHTLALQGDGVEVRDVKGALVAKFPGMKLKLSVLGFLMGRFVPAELSIDNLQLWFVRRADGSVWFGGMETGKGEETPGTEGVLSFWEATKHFSQEITAAGRLHDLSLTRATVSVHDEVSQQDWTITVPEISLKPNLAGLNGQAKIEVGQPGRGALLEAQYTYTLIGKRHNLSVHFKNVNPSVLAYLAPRTAARALLDLPLTGEIAAITDKDLNVVTLKGKLEGGAGQLTVPDFWDTPQAVKGLKIEGQYNRQAGKLDLPVAEADFGGTKLSMKLEGRPVSGEAAKKFDMAFTMPITLKDLPMDRFASFWPKPIIPNPKAWIAANMSRGQFTTGNVTLKGRFAWNDIANMALDSADGKISATGGTVRYLEGMPVVEGVNAEGTFDLDHMDVAVSGGGIGAIRIVPFTLRMTDFQKNVQIIELPVKMAGPVPDIVRLMDSPPFGYAKAVGLKAENVEGDLEGTLFIKLPMLNDVLLKDVEVKADAQLTGFGAHKMIPDIDLSQGNMALAVDKESYSLKGPVALNKVPLHVEWTSRFGAAPQEGKPESEAVVSGQVGGEQWAQLGLADLAGKFKGPVGVNVKYTQAEAALARVSGEADFRQTAVQFDELGWKKAAGTSALLKFSADVPKNKDINITSIDLQGTGLKVMGKAVLDLKTQQFLSIDLKPFIIGRTNAALQFSQTFGDKGELRFNAEGEAFDVSGLTGGKDPARSDPRTKSYDIKLGKLITSENGFIGNIKASAKRDSQGWSEIELHGMADGGHPLDISLTARNGRRTFSLTCDDFGKALKGMGFTDTVRDGPIDIAGESFPDKPREIEGTVKIGHFVVAGLPVLARLMSVSSPFGFIDFVTGNASFDHLEGQFRWKGDEVELQKVRAAGSVFGINIDGRVDLNTGDSNLHGTMVPFSMFNKLINAIPLLGDVFTGGEGGGVLAVSYTVKGKLAEPDVSVNPVSLLTPGFLRNLFFEDHTDEQTPENIPEAGKASGGKTQGPGAATGG